METVAVKRCLICPKTFTPIVPKQSCCSARCARKIGLDSEVKEVHDHLDRQRWAIWEEAKRREVEISSKL